MPRPLTSLAPALLAILAAACAGPVASDDPEGSADPATPTGPAPLEVVAFNVRYGAANDGEDRWELREEHVLATIEASAPDLLAVQEALAFQADAIAARLPHHVKVGQHREGGRKNEFSGLFVDGRRLAVEASGDLWLSDTPDVVGSVGWDAALTRNATWAVLADRTTGRRFVAVGTHFDHRGARARLESARLLAATLGRLGREHATPGASPLPGLLLGDLNAGEDSAPLEALRAAGLVDTFRAVHPDATEVGTFNGFRDRRDGAKIDFVLATADWQVLDAAIDRPRRPDAGVERSASDHEPVRATLALP